MTTRETCPRGKSTNSKRKPNYIPRDDAKPGCVAESTKPKKLFKAVRKPAKPARWAWEEVDKKKKSKKKSKSSASSDESSKSKTKKKTTTRTRVRACSKSLASTEKPLVANSGNYLASSDCKWKRLLVVWKNTLELYVNFHRKLLDEKTGKKSSSSSSSSVKKLKVKVSETNKVREEYVKLYIKLITDLEEVKSRVNMSEKELTSLRNVLYDFVLEENLVDFLDTSCSQKLLKEGDIGNGPTVQNVSMQGDHIYLGLDTALRREVQRRVLGAPDTVNKFGKSSSRKSRTEEAVDENNLVVVTVVNNVLKFKVLEEGKDAESVITLTSSSGSAQIFKCVKYLIDAEIRKVINACAEELKKLREEIKKSVEESSKNGGSKNDGSHCGIREATNPERLDPHACAVGEKVGDLEIGKNHRGAKVITANPKQIDLSNVKEPTLSEAEKMEVTPQTVNPTTLVAVSVEVSTDLEKDMALRYLSFVLNGFLSSSKMMRLENKKQLEITVSMGEGGEEEILYLFGEYPQNGNKLHFQVGTNSRVINPTTLSTWWSSFITTLRNGDATFEIPAYLGDSANLFVFSIMKGDADAAKTIANSISELISDYENEKQNR